MKISELIKKLEQLKARCGDLPVRVQSLSHMWDPEPTVIRKQSSFVLLNP